MKLEAKLEDVNVVGAAGDGARMGVKLGVGAVDEAAGLGVGFAGRGVLDLVIGRENVVGMIGFVGCGAIVLVWPKDNLGDVSPANEDGGGLVVLGAISNSPNADDKCPKALKLDVGGKVVVVTGGAG